MYRCKMILILVSGSKTGLHIGVTESLLMTSICGVLFALFGGQPLIVIGLTGPMLVFEGALYEVSVALSHCAGNHLSNLEQMSWITAFLSL